MCPLLYQFPRRTYGANTWHRDGGSNPVGGSRPLCRDNSKTLVNMDFRASLDQGNEAGASYDPWPIRTPSNSLSEDENSSYQGPVSPPRIDRLNYLGLDDSARTYVVTPTMRLFLPRVGAGLRGITA